MKSIHRFLRHMPLKVELSYILAIAGLLSVQSCLDPIELDVPAKERETLIIQAKLGKGNPSIVEASVNRLFDFTAASRQPVVVRYVRLLDEDGNARDLETTSISTYRAVIGDNDPDISIEYGKSYQIRVATFDNREFVSDFELLSPAPVPDGLTFERGKVHEDSTGIDTDIVRISVSTDLRVNQSATQKSRMRWDVEYTFQATDFPIDGTEPKTCWITQQADLNDIKVVDGEELSEERIDDFPVVDLKIGTNFAEGIYVSVYQESLTEQAYKYWEQVGGLVNRTGIMFEPPVGKVVTNFRNANDETEDEIFGFFYATTREVARIYIDPADVGNPTPSCPWTGPIGLGRGCNIPLICCDCSQLTGSSTVKPEFWLR